MKIFLRLVEDLVHIVRRGNNLLVPYQGVENKLNKKWKMIVKKSTPYQIILVSLYERLIH